AARCGGFGNSEGEGDEEAYAY
ncbi:hypothetical protein A2U01_0048677, partial [Trifolium medium]|nr:hypothetical protein [Trifolium medium]